MARRASQFTARWLALVATGGAVALGGCVGGWNRSGDVRVTPLIPVQRSSEDAEGSPSSDEPKAAAASKEPPHRNDTRDLTAANASPLESALAEVLEDYRNDLRQLPPADRARVVAALAALSNSGDAMSADPVAAATGPKSRPTTGESAASESQPLPSDAVEHAGRKHAEPLHGSVGDHTAAAKSQAAAHRDVPENGTVKSGTLESTGNNTARAATLVKPDNRSNLDSQPGTSADQAASDGAAANGNADRVSEMTGKSDWESQLQRSIAALRRELAQPADKQTLSDSELARRELVLKMMQVVAGDTEEALAEFQFVDRKEAEFWRNELFGLHLGLRENRTPVASQRAARMLEHLQKASWEMAAISALDLRNAAFCKNVFGYADIEPFRPYRFTPDQEVLLYVEIENFAAERIAAAETSRSTSGDHVRYETEFHGSYQILDGQRRRVADQQLPHDKQSCRNRRRDYYIAYRIYMPRNIAPGNYTLELTLEDVKGQKFGQAYLDFEISR